MNEKAEKLVKKLALQAGAIIAKKFGKVGVKYTKTNIADVVTEADLAANKTIIRGIRRAFPDHDIISEELPGADRKSKYVWIIDPLDGTRNFVTGVPFFCTMICLAEGDTVKLAVIYDPIHKDLYFARSGGGAFLNGKKISCSKTIQWEQSFGCAPSGMRKEVPGIMRKLIKSAEETPIWISALSSIGMSFASVAAGKRDWGFSLAGSVWDYAPAYLLLKEAGCKVTDSNGKAWELGSKGIVAGNKHLQPQLLKLIRG